MLSFPGFLVQVQSFFKSKPSLAMARSYLGDGKKGGVGQMPFWTPGSGSGAVADSYSRNPMVDHMSKTIGDSGSNWHQD